MRILLTVLLSFSSLTLAENFEEDLVNAAFERTKNFVVYNGAYRSIAYPNGDVPANIGVCTDVVIRSYRTIGIDLQKLVHEDMLANFTKYPSKKIWGLNKTDSNIDHRRVPNLQTFFKRKGKQLPISSNPEDYKPGDLVTWMVSGNLPHIGIVTDQINSNTGNPYIVHNIGWGPKKQDMLFDYKISGHYKYTPEKHMSH